eukprot:COSAG01_NODE_107_length_25964_cov_174.577576_16_plen_196_part_00
MEVRSIVIRVRVEIVGPRKYGNGGESPSILAMRMAWSPPAPVRVVWLTRASVSPCHPRAGRNVLGVGGAVLGLLLPPRYLDGIVVGGVRAAAREPVSQRRAAIVSIDGCCVSACGPHTPGCVVGGSRIAWHWTATDSTDSTGGRPAVAAGAGCSSTGGKPAGGGMRMAGDPLGGGAGCHQWAWGAAVRVLSCDGR